MELSLYQVDAFAARPFTGNPAAVCPLARWLPDATLQAIAAENNLAETAFFVPADAGGADYELRWFTPTVEVDLCGHATLASAFVLTEHLKRGQEAIRFASRGGPLAVSRADNLYILDFPAQPPAALDDAAAVAAALGAVPRAVLAAAGNALAVYDEQRAVSGLAPDLAKVAALPFKGVIATAPGDFHDFVSRYFAPAAGIPEDPVTGSAHCLLIPYWAGRLGKETFHARQISARGGDLRCRLAGERVHIGGQCALYLEGRLHIDDADVRQ